MGRWASIKYREFWDVPRIFFVENEGHLYLFDCLFDRDLEDYPDEYQIFVMPPLSEADFSGSWADMRHRSVARVGTVPVSAVRFDPTKRAAIDADVFNAIPPMVPQLNGVAAHAESPTAVP